MDAPSEQASASASPIQPSTKRGRRRARQTELRVARQIAVNQRRRGRTGTGATAAWASRSSSTTELAPIGPPAFDVIGVVDVEV